MNIYTRKISHIFEHNPDVIMQPVCEVEKNFPKTVLQVDHRYLFVSNNCIWFECTLMKLK